jgi:dienelactone hydrolase
MQLTSVTSSDGVTEQLFTLPFPFGEIPGVLWTPEHATGARPLILMGHGGGQHKKAPGIVARARRFAHECGFAVAAVDAPGHGDRPKSAEFNRIVAEMRSNTQTGSNTQTDRAQNAGEVTELVAGLHGLLVEQSVPEWRAVIDALQQLEHVGAGPLGYWGISLGCGLGVPFIAAEPRVRAAVLGLNGDETSAQAAAQITIPIEFLIQWDDEMVPRARALALFDSFRSDQKSLHANAGKHAAVPRFEVDSSVRFFVRHLSA